MRQRPRRIFDGGQIDMMARDGSGRCQPGSRAARGGKAAAPVPSVHRDGRRVRQTRGRRQRLVEWREQQRQRLRSAHERRRRVYAIEVVAQNANAVGDAGPRRRRRRHHRADRRQRRHGRGQPGVARDRADAGGQGRRPQRRHGRRGGDAPPRGRRVPREQGRPRGSAAAADRGASRRSEGVGDVDRRPRRSERRRRLGPHRALSRRTLRPRRGR